MTSAVSGMDVGAAVEALRAGWKVRREGWTSWLALWSNAASGELAILAFDTAGGVGPWAAASADLLATDWQLAGRDHEVA